MSDSNSYGTLPTTVAREPFCIPTLIEAIERGTYLVPQPPISSITVY